MVEFVEFAPGADVSERELSHSDHLHRAAAGYAEAGKKIDEAEKAVEEARKQVALLERERERYKEILSNVMSPGKQWAAYTVKLDVARGQRVEYVVLVEYRESSPSVPNVRVLPAE